MGLGGRGFGGGRNRLQEGLRYAKQWEKTLNPQQRQNYGIYNQLVPLTDPRRTAGSFHAALNYQPPGAMGPAQPMFSGGGGGGRGGGGGGGGAPAMTQAMFDAMLQAIGTGGRPLQMQQANLPAFRGTNIPAFNAQPYNQLNQQLATAVNADQAAAAQGATQAAQALQANYTNPYANATVAATPPAEQVGVGLQATAGGGGDQAAQAAQQNAAAASDQASFANLLSVLGATDQAAQSSRLNQVELDKQTALRNIGAQRTGIGAQIGMARTGAYEQWRQADAERRNQNAMMQQQWQREALMRQQDIANQGRTANWQQRNEMISSRLQPLLELLGGTQGSTVNTAALQQLLSRWAA